MEPLFSFKVVIFTVMSTKNSHSPSQTKQLLLQQQQQQQKLRVYVSDNGTNKMILFVGRVWKTKGEKWTKQWAEELEP